MTAAPILYLIPTPLGAPDTPCLLPHEQAQITGLTDFVVEAEKTARTHLKHLGITTPIRALNLQALNEHTNPQILPDLLQPLHQGRSMGFAQRSRLPSRGRPRRRLGGARARRRLRSAPACRPLQPAAGLDGFGRQRSKLYF
jgi:16S rRNA (cytidine1402-2'-O)-methyltransferase